MGARQSALRLRLVAADPLRFNDVCNVTNAHLEQLGLPEHLRSWPRQSGTDAEPDHPITEATRQHRRVSACALSAAAVVCSIA